MESEAVPCEHRRVLIHKKFIAIAAAAAALALTGCTVTDTVAPSAEVAPAPSSSAEGIAEPVFARELPDGYEYPASFDTEEAQGQWWWCAQLDAARHAYFERNDE